MGLGTPVESIAVKCKRGAEEALKMIEQGKLASQCNEVFKEHAGTKLRYRNRADFIRLLKFYANVPC